MEYSKYTMRGGSELTPEHDLESNDGLDLDYATAWSYGIEETPNLMIPDFNGGASSGAITFKDSETETLLREAGQTNLKQVMKNLPLYWGPQPFTAGPMYMGAVTVFLFILGLCICDRKENGGCWPQALSPFFWHGAAISCGLQGYGSNMPPCTTNSGQSPWRL